MKTYVLQEAAHIKNKVDLISPHIQCLHLIYSGESWLLVCLGTQVWPHIILDPDYVPEHGEREFLPLDIF